jgi:hypothetical protein
MEKKKIPQPSSSYFLDKCDAEAGKINKEEPHRAEEEPKSPWRILIEGTRIERALHWFIRRK